MRQLAEPRHSGQKRRFMVSAQATCSHNEARLLRFLSQFIQIDIFGACALLVTWNTRHAHRLLYRGVAETGASVSLQDYELALILDSEGIRSRNTGVTAVIWEALEAGTVPVYWGARNLKDWLLNFVRTQSPGLPTLSVGNCEVIRNGAQF